MNPVVDITVNDESSDENGQNYLSYTNREYLIVHHTYRQNTNPVFSHDNPVFISNITNKYEIHTAPTIKIPIIYIPNFHHRIIFPWII